MASIGLNHSLQTRSESFTSKNKCILYLCAPCTVPLVFFIQMVDLRRSQYIMDFQSDLSTESKIATFCDNKINWSDVLKISNLFFEALTGVPDHIQTW